MTFNLSGEICRVVKHFLRSANEYAFHPSQRSPNIGYEMPILETSRAYKELILRHLYQTHKLESLMVKLDLSSCDESLADTMWKPPEYLEQNERFATPCYIIK